MMCVATVPEAKRRYNRRAQPAEQRRSTRLELKRQEMDQLMLTEQLTSSLSEDSDGLSDVSPKRASNDQSEPREQSSPQSPDDDQPAQVKTESSPGDRPPPTIRTRVRKRRRGRGRPRKVIAAGVGTESQSAVGDGEPPVKRPRGRPRKVICDASIAEFYSAVCDGVKRPRGRPRKVREDTASCAVSSEDVKLAPTVAGIGDLLAAGDAGLVAGEEPLTLSLSPPPMPAGKVAQPSGVLMLPLYSAVPTEPGHQSSLMLVQPQQLANLPLGADPTSALLPVLTANQPILVTQPPACLQPAPSHSTDDRL